VKAEGGLIARTVAMCESIENMSEISDKVRRAKTWFNTSMPVTKVVATSLIENLL
jgi:hypothetical protein